MTQCLSFILTYLQTMRHKSRTVQTQMLNVKATRCRHPKKRAVILFSDMLAEVVMEGMQDALSGVGLPVIALSPITGEAAVNPVGRCVLTGA